MEAMSHSGNDKQRVNKDNLTYFHMSLKKCMLSIQIGLMGASMRSNNAMTRGKLYNTKTFSWKNSKWYSARKPATKTNTT